jgi:hypothetical protein
MPGAFDLGPFFQSLKEIFVTIVRIPFEFWYNVNPWLKLGISIFIAILCVFITLFVIKNREKWKYRTF